MMLILKIIADGKNLQVHQDYPFQIIEVYPETNGKEFVDFSKYSFFSFGPLRVYSKDISRPFL